MASATAGGSPAARPKVIYIMGAGRSGSTVLGVALGNCAGVFFAGELDKWLARSGVPQLNDLPRERFWAEVLERVPDAQALFGFEAQRCLERSSALLRVRDWPARRRLRGPYRRISQDLYRAIAQTTGASQIVDSSHYPLRARELQALDGVDLHIVFLVRDPQGVVASFDRRDVVERRFGMLTTNAYLWLTYLLSLAVFLRQPRARRLFVRREDFIADPAGVLRRVLELGGSTAATPDLGALRTGVPFQGNRLLRDEVIALRSSAERPARHSLSTTLLQLPWAVVFSLLRPAAGRSA